MILSKALALGFQLMMPFAVADGVPELNVQQVCEGIAKQGGVTFHDPAIAKEKQNCLESERATRDELAKKWSEFTPADRTSCVNEARMGGELKLHRAADLPGNGAGCQGDARAAGWSGDQPPVSGGAKATIEYNIAGKILPPCN